MLTTRHNRYWTHYVPVFSRPQGRDELALCLRCIHPSYHSATPTCPRCRELLGERLNPVTRVPQPEPVERWT